MSGRLEIIIGNMFSGKSTELIRRINRERSINKQILVINYLADNRYSTDSVSTHDRNSVKCLKMSKLMDFQFNDINSIDSFFIDEAQFFPDLFKFVTILTDFYNKHVVVAGLAGDVTRSKFGEILDLVPHADTVDKLNAYCTMCKDRTYAPFTKRIDNNTESGDENVDIGGSDKYISVCRKHYLSC